MSKLSKETQKTAVVIIAVVLLLAGLLLVGQRISEKPEESLDIGATQEGQQEERQYKRGIGKWKLVEDKSLDIRGTEEGRLAEEYLLLKYGEEFVLGETYTYQHKATGTVDHYTKIHTKANPAVEAYIRTTRAPDLSAPMDKATYYDGTFYADDYLDVLWNHQYRAEIEPLMKKWFGNDVLFEISPFFTPAEYPYGKLLTYKEVRDLEKHPLEVNAIIFTKDGKAMERAGEKALAHFCLQAEHHSHTFITFGFYKEADKEKVLNQLEDGATSVLYYPINDIAHRGDKVRLEREVYQQSAMQIKALIPVDQYPPNLKYSPSLYTINWSEYITQSTPEELDIRGTEEGRLVEEYLLLKYGEEFVLGETHATHSFHINLGEFIGKYTEIYAKANPGVVGGINTADVPDLYSAKDKAAYYDGTFYGDGYVNELWNYQYRADMEPLMKEWFGDDVIFQARLAWYPEAYPWYGKLLSYKEAWDMGERWGREFNAIIFTEDGKIAEEGSQKAFAHFRSQLKDYPIPYITFGFYKQADKEKIFQQLEDEETKVLDYVADDFGYKDGWVGLRREVYQQSAISVSDKEQLLLDLKDMQIFNWDKDETTTK